MLSFFPRCYDDELLYSVLSRYHLRSGNHSFKRTIMELFSIDSLIPTSDLPCNLVELCKNIGFLYDPIYLRDNHTLLPYYRPFLKESIVEKVENMMLYEKGSSLHMSLGIMGSNIPFPKNLKYCLDCYNQDQLRYGEPYWHRSHQLPGVYICPIHNSQLVCSDVSFKIQSTRQKFYALSEVDIVEPYEGLLHHFEILKFISNESQALLKLNLDVIGLKNLRNYYLMKLKEYSYTTTSSRVNMAKFVPQFISKFGRDALKLLECNINSDDQDTWLHKVLRKPRVSCHPLRHLLLLYYFNTNISSYRIVKKHSNLFFNDPPYPCLNKASDHFGKAIVTNIKEKFDRKNGQPIGIFTCKCGFVYTRVGPERCYSDRYTKRRIISFGDIWISKVKYLYAKGDSIYKIAKKLEVDYNTVKSIIQRKDIVEKPNQVNNSAYNRKFEYRGRWIHHKENGIGLSRTELRKSLPSVYIWLYRNDREWLFKNLPPKLKPVCKKNIINWENRDNDIFLLINNEFLKLINTVPLVRITKSKIGRAVGKISLLEKHLDKLPKSRKLLEEVTETVEEFRIRRVRHAAKSLRNKHSRITRWKLVRAANLPQNFGINVNEIISEELKKNKNNQFDIS
ncbi:TnsD family Tn7-like transposition protein [Fredinandcohnia sp. QZ13]|uniref:TnsD family Tn7-like transposition protein n=1 Tax=Fredinandcohnia sp. QZ13 TaxID=3073144 RepID=UPI0028535683|nr:TnsD family Tn7-like transposition protein [Fredinandcohnia sp. QZ13]MDR4888384.1 TnsD family Tn7-like transposition protein [Fredinandcohnia sp. QZ13]